MIARKHLQALHSQDTVGFRVFLLAFVLPQLNPSPQNSDTQDSVVTVLGNLAAAAVAAKGCRTRAVGKVGFRSSLISKQNPGP